MSSTKTITEIISNYKINIPCSTKTYVAKTTSNGYKKTIPELQEILKGSYTTKFRNCVIKKINKISLKLYTNMTLQISGVTTEEDLFILIRTLNFGINYNIKCVMSNWTIKISENIIDLFKTMNNLNNNNILSYFLRGYPLIIKFKEKIIQEKILNISYNGEIKTFFSDLPEIEISILMFKSGSCIVSGKSEKICAKAILQIKQFLIFV